MNIIHPSYRPSVSEKSYFPSPFVGSSTSKNFQLGPKYPHVLELSRLEKRSGQVSHSLRREIFRSHAWLAYFKFLYRRDAVNPSRNRCRLRGFDNLKIYLEIYDVPRMVSTCSALCKSSGTIRLRKFHLAN